MFNGLMLSSFRCAVLDGRNQLFETMKRGGAGLLSGVVKPQITDVVHRPVAGLGQGRRRERNIMVEIQKYWVRHTRRPYRLGYIPFTSELKHTIFVFNSVPP